MVLMTLTLTLMALISSSMTQAPGSSPTPGGNGYPQVQSSHCRYLINAPSPWGVNASPFKLYTRSYAGEVRKGYPIEVSILPLYERFKGFNFTDFALWSEPLSAAPPTHRREMERAWGGGAAMPPPSPNTVSHVGVWKVFPQYAGGAGSLRCNVYSRGEDTVGTFEGRMLELLKTQFPGDGRLINFNPSARSGAAFLWYPDDNALNSGAIKFVAKLKSFSQWFHLESTPWKVYIPPPPPPPMTFNFNPSNMNTMVDRTVDIYQQLQKMERKLDTAANPAV